MTLSGHIEVKTGFEAATYLNIDGLSTLIPSNSRLSLELNWYEKLKFLFYWFAIKLNIMLPDHWPEILTPLHFIRINGTKGSFCSDRQ